MFKRVKDKLKVDLYKKGTTDFDELKRWLNKWIERTTVWSDAGEVASIQIDTLLELIRRVEAIEERLNQRM